MSAESGNPKSPVSGLDHTIASKTISDDTIPASESLKLPVEPARMSRSSIPPTPTHRYRHGNELGRGGMGRVVEAYDTQLGRTVALKEVQPETTSVERRFAREIEITARLEHHGIVPLYDSGTTPDGRPFYVMRRVTGKPLDQVIHAAKQLDDRLKLLPAMLAAIDAIAHAHKRSVIHRDLKPTNILVGEDGETVVIDWGLAKVIDETDETDDANSPRIQPLIPTASDSLQTLAGAVFGTPGFMAPEQARGEALTTSTDVYALGATLYQLLAGKPPMTGTSATEVIGKTLTNDVKPLAQVVDGVPRELIAIVDKALAFDAVVRYRNAGELAEDLRRFLDGRLVDAHNYTRGQRVARFIRKHRAILGVIALALVAVAAFAWFSVSRVLAERDAAREARKQALVEKHAAESARDRLAERNDALVVTQARGLLETNPTHSLAMLADLSPSSKRLADARSVAKAAVARGVWWGMKGPDAMTIRIELSFDGDQLLQGSRDNVLRVWDLNRKKLVIARPTTSATEMRWVRDGKVLLYSDKMQPEVLDPAGNATQPLAGPPITGAYAPEGGEQVLVREVSGAAALMDLTTGTRTPLWPGHEMLSGAIAHDGSWIAILDKTSAVILDRTGKEIATRTGIDGAATRIVGSRHRKLALVSLDTVIELAFDPTPTWTELPLQAKGLRRRVADAIYRTESLELLVFGGEVLGWRNGNLVPRGMQIDTITGVMRVAANNVLLLPNNESRVGVMTGVAKMQLLMPLAAPHARVLATPASPRVIVVGDGIIMGMELTGVLPKRLPWPSGTNNFFIDADTLFTWRNMRELSWGAVDGSPPKVITTADDAATTPASADPSSGRVILREESGRGTRMLLVTKNETTPREIATGPAPWAALIRGDAMLFGTGESKPDGRIFARVGTGEPREVAKVDGDVASIVSLAPQHYAVLSSRGELVRGNLTTNQLTRANIQPGDSMFLATDFGQRVVIIVDSRMYVWEGSIVEVAKFEKTIRQVDVLANGSAIVQLQDRDTYRVPLVANAKVERLLAPSQYEAMVDIDGTTMVSLVGGYQISVLDLATATRFTLPLAQAARASVSVSPNGRRIVQDTFDGLVLWSLVVPDADLGAWISEYTTARVVGDVLTWPWQPQ